MSQSTEASRDKPVAEGSFVHLFDSLMTLSSTAKALAEETLHLAADKDKGGKTDATENA